MYGRGRIAALVAIATIAASTAAMANPSLDLGRARKQYDEGAYTDAVGTLYRLLYIDKVSLPIDETLEAHRLLGISYFFLTQKAQADGEFLEVLRIDPDYELNPELEDPGVVAAYLNVRSVHQDELREIRHQRALAEAKKELPIREVLISREIRDPETWKNWMPFGVGQFKNDQDRKGFLFLGAELALATTSATTFGYQVLKYGLPSSSHVDNSDVSDIRLLQVLQIGTGVGFFIVYAWSVIDAYAYTRPRVVEKKSERLVPTDPNKDQPQSYMPTLVPIVTPSGVALAAQWEF